MKDGLNRFRCVCPRQLSCLPSEPCPLALDQINAIKSDGSDKRKREIEPVLPGCPWYISSAEHNHCFWSLNRFLDSDPISDREICDMLLIHKSTLERVTDAVITHLKSIKDTEAIQDFKETVMDMIGNQCVDFTNYMPNEFRDSIKSVIAVDESASQDTNTPKIKRKHPTGLPLHRDGTKVDLYGLTSRRKIVKPEEVVKPVEKPKKRKKNGKNKSDQKQRPSSP